MAENPAQKSFSLLVAAAFADGDASEGEVAMLRRKAAEARIPSAQLVRMFEEAQQGTLRLSYPASREEREKRLDDILDILCADGRLETPERQFMLRYTTSLGGVPEDLNERIRVRMRRAERQEARPVEIQIGQMPDSGIQITRTAEPPRPPASPPQPVAAGTPSLEPIPAGPSPMAPPTKDLQTVPPLPPGPIQLAPPQLLGTPVDLPPITLALVRQVIEFEGRNEAAAWLERSCLMDTATAQAAVERILQSDPSLKPAARKIISRR